VAVGWVASPTVAAPPAATAAASEELGRGAAGVGCSMAGGVGMALWAGVLVGVDWFGEVAFGAMAPGDCFLNCGYYGVGWHCAGQVCLLACPHP